MREIGLFTTILVTRDMNYLSIPNSTIFGGLIINYSRERLRRVSFDVVVASLQEYAVVLAVPRQAAVIRNENLSPAPPEKAAARQDSKDSPDGPGHGAAGPH